MLSVSAVKELTVSLDVTRKAPLMADKKQPASASSSVQRSNPKKLGNQPQGGYKQGAARRSDKQSKKSNSRYFGWIAVAVVIIVVGVFVGIDMTKSSNSSTTTTQTASSDGVVTGNSPLLAPADVVNAVTTIPVSVYNSVGVGSQPPAQAGGKWTGTVTEPFAVLKDQPKIPDGSKKPTFVYYGAEYCPFCALMRWSLVMALSRFGHFSNLHETTSSSTDINPNTPTFTFYHSSYKSPYIDFIPYEYLNRLEQQLQIPSQWVLKLYLKYDGTAVGNPAPTYNIWGSAGVPFVDIDNHYTSAGDPPSFAVAESALTDGGPGRLAIAQAMRDPTGQVGMSFDAGAFLAEANYMSAGICNSDGNKPASVCDSQGVLAAKQVLSKQTKIG